MKKIATNHIKKVKPQKAIINPIGPCTCPTLQAL